MAQLMRGIMTSYSSHFNKKNKRSGPLFESRYKASLIHDAAYLEHTSRYIHLNPREWHDYQFSSIKAYRSGHCPEWLQPERIMTIFDSREDYLSFLNEYQNRKDEIDLLKSELADA